MSNRATPLALAVLSTAAWAQSPPGGDGPAATLEAVVVTARYREESLQRVPISISAIGGNAIADGQVTTLQGLEFVVPNLVFGETGASAETFIGIRGIGDFSRNIGFDTRVGVYVDGVFVGQSLAVDQGLIDVQQVEVLRGPQGTLFGKNSSSGVIQIVSRRPVPGESSGEWRLRGGNLGTVAGSGTVNVPLGESAAARIALVAQRQDGYIDNLLNGDELMSNDHAFGRVRVLARPSEALELDFTLDFRRQDNDILFLEPDASYELAAGNPAAAAPFVVDQDAPLIDENSGWGAGLRLNYTLPGGSVLTSIAGYRSSDRRTGSDEDATRAFALHARYFEDEFDHFTGELRLASPGDARFRYVLGAFWFDQDASTDRIAALGPAWGGPPQGIDAATQHSRVDSRSWAVFANANLDLTERLTASAGLRYSEEDKDAVIHQIVFPGFGLAELIDQSMSRSEGYGTATANLQYQFNDDMSAYFTYASGYKGGGFNVDLVANAADLPFEEETVDSFELGLKSSLLGGRLRLNLAAFHAEYDDYQVFQFRFNPASGTTTLLISNAAAVTTEGFELEGTALFGAAFSLDFGVGYNDAQFDDFPGGAIDGSTGLPLNVAGNRLPRAPEWTADLGGTWRFALGTAPTRLTVGYSYRSEQFFNPDNRENSRQGAYGLWNATLECELSQHWSVALYGRNLGDEEFRTMRGISFLGVPFGLYSQPRTYGAEITFRH